tara:strand:- start:174 stop:434 length:261 start_codon:yes stop_codon:yes gene_type:complete
MQPLSKAWQPVHKAEKILDIDRKDLHRMRDDGTLKLGKHYGAGPMTRSRDTYYWNIPRMEHVLYHLRKRVVELNKQQDTDSNVSAA